MFRRRNTRSFKGRPTVDDTRGNRDRVTNAWNLLSLINDWVRHAEAKLNLVFTFLGVMLAGLITLSLSAEFSSHCAVVTYTVAVVSVVLGITFAGIGALPRLREASRARGEKSAGAGNLLYYADIDAKYGKKVGLYISNTSQLLGDDDELTAQILQQVHSNSKVAVDKYKWIRRAVACGAVVAGFLLLFTVTQMFDFSFLNCPAE